MYNERLPVFCFCNTVYLAVCELKSPSMSDFLWGLENSGWLRHIKAIMDAGIFIAKVCDCREQSMGQSSQCTVIPDMNSPVLSWMIPGSGSWLCRPPWNLPFEDGILWKMGWCSVDSVSSRQSTGKILSEQSEK